MSTTNDRHAFARLVATAVAAVAVVCLAGCTMCPNPFDYAGPVPNGSAPQNDFQARSNGVIPIGATPRPWPPLVQREDDAKEPTIVLAASPGEPTRAPEPKQESEIDTEIEAADSVVQIDGESHADSQSE